MRKGLLLLAVILFAQISAYGQKQIYTNPIVVKAVKFDKTRPLREIPPIDPASVFRGKGLYVIPNFDDPVKEKKPGALPIGEDPVLQKTMGNSPQQLTPLKNWEGIGNVNGVLPPDTDGDVGPNHYVQMLNLSFQIWDKDGNSLYGPADNSTLWDGFGDPWDGTNDGDPIVLYDEEADRWLFTQFSLPNGSSTPPYYMLLAITETGDPTGSWYRYGFEFQDMPDYPKFGIWNDGYYLSTVAFSGGSYRGVDAVVFERDKMLVGDSTATMQIFKLDFTANPYAVRMLPSDFDGTPPPDGTPNYFIYMGDDGMGYTSDHLSIWEFHTDWNNPSNSTFAHVTDLTTAPFDYQFTSNTFSGRSHIEQPNTSIGLDALSNRVMFRLQYRNFGDYSTLVTNHTVDVDGSDHAGVRWYELRNSGTGWGIYQQGTYAPDSENRWMASVAMDEYGNIALGYSVSSNSVYPSIRYAGRMKDDPLGTISVAEQTIIDGSGSQTSFFSRWGDYSAMSVDPIDGATFWYTTEYVKTTGDANWQTRIASFTFGSDLSMKIFLEGNYSSGVMTTTLNSNGYLPTSQPFTGSPWNYNGSEKVSLVDSDTDGIVDFFENHTDIVDWILIELRSGTASSSVVAKRAGFIKSDGTIVGLDGTSPLRLGVMSGSYYVVVHHRNHLSVMSANPVSLSNSAIASYDFTTGSGQFYGSNGAVDLGNGVWGMIAGNAENTNSTVDAADRNATWNDRNKTGYENSDVDLNGVVDASDRNLTWNNRNKTSAVPN